MHLPGVAKDWSVGKNACDKTVEKNQTRPFRIRKNSKGELGVADV